MAFEFTITANLTKFEPLMKGRVALPTSKSPNDGPTGQTFAL